MTHFIAEAKRLGLQEHIPVIFDGFDRSQTVDDEGLCVSGCTTCRYFRNLVRNAIEAERVAEFEAAKAYCDSRQASYDAGYQDGQQDACLETMRALRNDMQENFASIIAELDEVIAYAEGTLVA